MDKKMKSLLTITIIALIFFSNTLYAAEKIHEDWVQADRTFIRKVVKKLKQEPLKIDEVLLTSGGKKEKLGFGYHFISGSHGKGYVSIFYQFVYYNNQLLSFELQPQMPRDEQLILIYKKFYENIFDIDLKNKITPYHHNLSKVDIPLTGYQSSLKIPKEIKYYMTPYSGIIYGNRGGYANSLLQNRTRFLSITKGLNAETCIVLLFSINPASRLTAYEYYLLNQDKFTKEEIKTIEKRIELIFTELPDITTMYGCKITVAKSRERVKSLLNESKTP